MGEQFADPRYMSGRLQRYGQGEWRSDTLFRWVARNVRGPAVLDVGCGSGLFAALLVRRGYAVLGIDTDAALIERARDLAPGASFEVVEGQSFERYRRSVNSAICLDVLEHIEDDRAILTAIAETVVPGGQILLSVPAHPWLYGRRDRLLGHYRRYTVAAARALCAAAGLRVVSLRRWNALGVAPYFLSERLLRCPVWDNFRSAERSWWQRSLNALVAGWLRLELRLPLPIGLSILIVAESPGQTEG